MLQGTVPVSTDVCGQDTVTSQVLYVPVSTDVCGQDTEISQVLYVPVSTDVCGQDTVTSQGTVSVSTHSAITATQLGVADSILIALMGLFCIYCT